jgi:hypothetical protein
MINKDMKEGELIVSEIWSFDLYSRVGRIGDMEFSTLGVQWVALGISLVAFIIGVPALLQMKYGAPKIIIDFDEEQVGDYHYLSCKINNMPIIKGFLKILCVRR